MIKIKPSLVSIAVSILLSACGGGDSTTNASHPDSTIISDIAISSSTTIDYSMYGGSGKNYYFRSGLLSDLDGDGKNEFVFSVTSYPQVPIPLTVVGDQNSAINLTNKYFPQGAPTALHSPWIWHADINGDGSKDIIALSRDSLFLKSEITESHNVSPLIKLYRSYLDNNNNRNISRIYFIIYRCILVIRRFKEWIYLDIFNNTPSPNII